MKHAGTLHDKNSFDTAVFVAVIRRRNRPRRLDANSTANPKISDEDSVATIFFLSYEAIRFKRLSL